MSHTYNRDYYQRTYGFNKQEMLELLERARKYDRAKALMRKKEHKVYVELFDGEVRVTARDGITREELEKIRRKYPNRKDIKVNI